MATENLSDEDIQAIAEATAQCMTKGYREFWIDPEAHYLDHVWTGSARKREKEIREFRKKVIASVTIWAVIACLGFILVATWHNIVDLIKG